VTVFVDHGALLGYGHAVLQAEYVVGRVAYVVFAKGVFDPVTDYYVQALVRIHRRTKSAATMLTAEVDEPGGYGRVIREGDHLVRIAEQADATPTERRIHEIATNWICFRRDDLYHAVPLVGRDNRQGEHYINRVYPILLDKGERVTPVLADTGGAMGVNSRRSLAAVERVVRRRINEAHMLSGVTIVDPSTTYIDAGVKVGVDSVIRPITFLEGDTRIGRRASVGPSTRIVDSVIGDDAEVTFSVVLGSKVGARATVGPYAHLRPDTLLDDGAVIGNFVEVKASRLRRGAKAKHLTYLGNADVGSGANVGAGTVTVNYDGYEKHRTVIGEGARIGSDTMLVAPVKVGRNANTGAGSVITKDVPAGALGVERAEQKNVKGYRARKDAERKGKGKH